MTTICYYIYKHTSRALFLSLSLSYRADAGKLGEPTSPYISILLSTKNRACVYTHTHTCICIYKICVRVYKFSAVAKALVRSLAAAESHVYGLYLYTSIYNTVQRSEQARARAICRPFSRSLAVCVACTRTRLYITVALPPRLSISSSLSLSVLCCCCCVCAESQPPGRFSEWKGARCTWAFISHGRIRSSTYKTPRCYCCSFGLVWLHGSRIVISCKVQSLSSFEQIFLIDGV